MAGSPARWQIREEESFQRCVAQLGGAAAVDRALATLIDALSLNPYGFPESGVGDIRLARTRLVFVGRDIIPALALRFRIEPPDRVALLHLELCLPEDMAPDDQWPWR